MARKPTQKLKLGDAINGTVLKSNGGRRFLVKSDAAPQGWKVELHARKPELVREGERGTFWVAKIAPLQGEVLVHDGDFGRLPISDAMRPRYLAALKALVGAEEPTAENLADAKTMVAQIGKRLQADWLTVWRLLGEPAPGDQKELLAAIEALRTARKEAPETVAEIQTKINEAFGDPLRTAIRRLEDLSS
jgi:hypothetical protein